MFVIEQKSSEKYHTAADRGNIPFRGGEGFAAQPNFPGEICVVIADQFKGINNGFGDAVDSRCCLAAHVLVGTLGGRQGSRSDGQGKGGERKIDERRESGELHVVSKKIWVG